MILNVRKTCDTYDHVGTSAKMMNENENKESKRLMKEDKLDLKNVSVRPAICWKWVSWSDQSSWWKSKNGDVTRSKKIHNEIRLYAFMDVEVELWICTGSGDEEYRQPTRRGTKCQAVVIQNGELTILRKWVMTHGDIFWNKRVMRFSF